MPKKKTDKKILPLEANFKDILVCEKSDFRPYIETFVQEPENIAEAGLGTLAGIFEITDQSEDSSYVVNYLVSIIKKEYYLKVKRGAVESLEAALHKANLALAKLAEHGNVNWLGHLHALIFVIEKRNVHLSQAGSARAFLLRGKVLADITDGEKTGNTPNPLKTFVDVLSGRLEKDDRLIITTDGIFDIFSFEEIKRSAIKFSPEEFTRFLHTALVNELPRAAVLVVDFAEKDDDVAEAQTRRPKKLNAFSQQAFSKTAPKPEKVAAAPESAIGNQEKQELVSELKNDIEKNNGNFVDKKTGHIYIKEDQFPYDETSKLSEIVGSITSKTSSLGEKTFRNLGAFGRKIRQMNWTGIFLEEEDDNEEKIPIEPRRQKEETFSAKEPLVPTRNISSEEAQAILSEVRTSEAAPEKNKTSHYKNYLKIVRVNAAPIASKISVTSGAAVARIKSAGLATARFASRSSAKAKPIIREKLARFKPKKKTSSDLPVTYQKEGIADQAKKDSWISSLFKEKFTGEKPGEAFRSGHNIAKKLGGRKLSELKSNEAVQPQIKKKMISAGPKPASLDMTSSSRTNPARPEGLERIDSILTKAPVEQSSTDIQSPVSPNKSIAAGQSSFVDSRRIDDLFSREKARVSPPSPIEPEESTLIKVNSTVPLDREYPKRETAVGALPDFRKIKNAASRFDYSQKLYAILAIIFLLIVPYFIVRWQNSRSKTNDAAVEKAPAQTQLQNTSTPDTKNGASTLNPSSVYSGTGITRLINLNGKIFVVSTGQVVDVQNKKTYPFPGDFGAAKISLGLSDLNLIFFINAKNQMISWSPAAPKFQPENLNLPANATVSYAKTYLTYLYVLDQNNNQVYRYPRTPDGFTDKTDWLKANADLSKAQDMAVNGNVFLTDSTGNLSEYFQGKKQNFQIGATIPPVKAAEVYAHNSDKYIYVLDKTNGRVAKLEANGQIVSQYADATFKKAVDFTVDESTGQIYVTDGTRVESFSMN